MAEQTEVAVIGAGPGGYTAAFYAADHGLDVTLIDKNPSLGGVCLNWGCIPSKFLLHLSKLVDEVREAEEMGIEYGSPTIHLDKIRDYKNQVVDKLNQGIGQLAKARKVKVVNGKARFLGPNRLEIEGEDSGEIDFEKAIIAVGSSSFIPPVFRMDSPRILTSKSALDLEVIPENLLVVGGGVIGLEMGSIYQALGSKVTVVEILDHLAPGVDRDLIRPLKKRLEEKFEGIHTSTEVTEIEENKEDFTVTMKGEEESWTADFDYILVATGRLPASGELGLSKLAIDSTEKGFIPVNSSFQTAKSHIYAIGDVIGNPMLAHKASREAKVAVEKILGHDAIWSQKGIPSVIYTDPEVAWVGLTEGEAKERKIDFEVGKFPWTASGRALSVGRTEGMTKILFDPESELVLGVGMVGVGAGELLAEGTLALELGARVEDIARTIHAHPTLSETFMESAEDFLGLATHKFRRKKKS